MGTDTKTRILIWNLPRMTREIVVPMLTADQAFTVVAPEAADEALETAVTRYEPDVVITQSNDNALDEACIDFLSPYRQRKVILIGNHAKSAYVHWPKTERVAVDNVSRQQLLNAIRGTSEAQRESA